MNLSGPFTLILAMLFSALMAIFLKAFPSGKNNRYSILVGNYITCILLAFFLLPDKGVIYSPERMTLLCGTISGVLFVASLVVMQASIGKNGAILTAAFGKLGLLVPLTFSILLLHERPSLLQWIGIALVFLALWFINQAANDMMNGERQVKKAAAKSGLVLLLIVLLVSGVTDGMAKVFEHLGSRSQDDLYILIVFVVAGVLATILLVQEYRLRDKKIKLKDFVAGFAVGVPNYFSSILLLKALTKLPAFIVYPAFSTGTILIITLVSTIVFKEKPGRKQVIGLVIILAALLLLNL